MRIYTKERNEKISNSLKKEFNEIIDCGNYYEMKLYDREGKEKARTKFSKDQLEKIKQYRWSMDSLSYVCNSSGLRLHQLIIGKRKGFITDHINRNTLDNRNKNLRFATKSQNGMNRKVKGISWSKNMKKWHTCLSLNRKRIFSEYFSKKKDALQARKKAEIKYFKEFRSF